MTSMARVNRKIAGNIQTAMIIAAALIEGFTFYALGHLPRPKSLGVASHWRSCVLYVQQATKKA